MKYVVNSDSFVVHREDCGLTRPKHYDNEAWWFSDWPGACGANATEFDRACRRCLSGGLPQVTRPICHDCPEPECCEADWPCDVVKAIDLELQAIAWEKGRASGLSWAEADQNPYKGSP